MNKIPELPSDFEKRARGKLAGKRGEGFAEVIEDPKRGKAWNEILKRLEEACCNSDDKNLACDGLTFEETITRLARLVKKKHDTGGKKKLRKMRPKRSKKQG